MDKQTLGEHLVRRMTGYNKSYTGLFIFNFLRPTLDCSAYLIEPYLLHVLHFIATLCSPILRVRMAG